MLDYHQQNSSRPRCCTQCYKNPVALWAWRYLEASDLTDKENYIIIKPLFKSWRSTNNHHHLLTNLLTDWLADYLIEWLDDWFINYWLTELNDWFIDILNNVFSAWLIDLMTYFNNWFIYWMTDHLHLIAKNSGDTYMFVWTTEITRICHSEPMHRLIPTWLRFKGTPCISTMCLHTD